MPSLNELGLDNTALDGAEFDQIPENIGQSYPDPVQPGTYRFKVPVFQITSPIWEKFASEKHGDRISASFEDDLALTIVQSPGKAHDGESYRFRVSNLPRERTKERILVSDMDLLLRALGCAARPKTNKEYAQALVKYVSGKEFSATQEFSWNCANNRDIYVDDGAGGSAKVEGKLGCGARYYQRDVGKVEGLYPVRITCSNPECGALIRAFGNLGGFKA